MKPLPRRPGAQLAWIKQRMRTTPGVIILLKQASLRVRLHEILAQKMASTWWQEFQKKSPAVPTPGTSSVKQKKIRSASQPEFRSKTTPARTDADQISLTFQQLVNNTNSASFINNIHQNSKLPKSPTTTLPTFDEKSKKFELFEDVFQTSLKIDNQLTEDDRINCYRCFKKKDALQTFKIINCPTGENLGKFLAAFSGKYVKPHSKATAGNNFQKFVFDPANQKLVHFRDEFQKLAKDASRIAGQAILNYSYTPKCHHTWRNQ